MNLESKLDFIEPFWSSQHNGVEAYFTLKNHGAEESEGDIPGLNLGLNTNDDVNHVFANRALMYKQFNLDPGWVAWGKQIHSTRVRIITTGGLHPDTDGMVSAIPGLALVIQVADCAAILMADKENRVIGAVHAGWRGAVGGILANGVDEMKKLGADPAKINAYVSPCISQKHYEVGAEVSEQFPDSAVDNTTYDKPHIDLRGYVHNELLQSGIHDDAIEIDPHCTYEEDDKLYSYRREQERSGRMLGIIVMR